ncbi:hypothetical protein Tco_0885196, partial [Tanacetum coccineum]
METAESVGFQRSEISLKDRISGCLNKSTIDTLEYTITEASVRSTLQLSDASGISMLPNTEIFEGMGNMGYPTDGGLPRLFLLYVEVIAQNASQADQARTQSQPSSSTVPAPTESTTIPPRDQAGTQSQPTSSTVPPPPTSPPTPVTEPTSEPSSPSPAPEHETMEHPFEQPSPEHQPSSPRQESAIPQTQAPTHTHEAKTGHMSVDDLFQLVPQLMTRIESLEKDLKQTKRNISPQGLEAPETLAEALSQIKTKRKNVKTGVRRRLDAEDVSTGFYKDAEDVSTGFTDIKSASEKVSSGGEHVSQREGKAILKETPQTKRTKKQIREEQSSLAEIARIQAEDEAKNERREELKRQDELAAKR